MLFKGRLRLPDDAGEGVPISLTLEDVYLTLDSQGEEFGEWRLDVVEISRLFSNQFSLMLDGEEMVFIADDALGFAYEGVSFVEDVQSRLKKRRFFKGRKAKRAKAPSAPAPQPEPEPEPSQATPASAPIEEPPMPEVRPFFPEPAAPSRQEAPSTAEPPQSLPPSEPEQRPAAVEPSAPARRAVHPLGDPDAEPVEAFLGESEPAGSETPPIPEPWRSTPAQTEPATEAEPDAPQQPVAPAVDDDVDDEELVIEDVNPYGYQAPISMAPESEARSGMADEPEPAAEVETAESAQAATVESPALDDVRSLDAESPALPVAEPEPEPEPEPEAEPEPLEPEPEPVAEVERTARETSDVEAEPDAAATDDLEEGSETDPRPGRHARSESKSLTSIFGRRRSKEPEPHDHVYESSKTVGGITRSVCSVCGHVSFAGEDVYQSW